MVIAAIANRWAECASLLGGGILAKAPLLLAQAEVERHYQIEQLDPATRAKVLAALTGLIILMIGLMILASMGARWARAYGRRTPLSFERRAKPKLDEDDWASKPLHPREDESGVNDDL
jgi:hypothetical protein